MENSAEDQKPEIVENGVKQQVVTSDPVVHEVPKESNKISNLDQGDTKTITPEVVSEPPKPKKQGRFSVQTVTDKKPTEKSPKISPENTITDKNITKPVQHNNSSQSTIKPESEVDPTAIPNENKVNLPEQPSSTENPTIPPAVPLKLDVQQQQTKPGNFQQQNSKFQQPPQNGINHQLNQTGVNGVNQPIHQNILPQQNSNISAPHHQTQNYTKPSFKILSVTNVLNDQLQQQQQQIHQQHQSLQNFNQVQERNHPGRESMPQILNFEQEKNLQLQAILNRRNSVPSIPTTHQQPQKIYKKSISQHHQSLMNSSNPTPSSMLSPNALASPENNPDHLTFNATNIGVQNNSSAVLGQADFNDTELTSETQQEIENRQTQPKALTMRWVAKDEEKTDSGRRERWRFEDVAKPSENTAESNVKGNLESSSIASVSAVQSSQSTPLVSQTNINPQQQQQQQQQQQITQSHTGLIPQQNGVNLAQINRNVNSVNQNIGIQANLVQSGQKLVQNGQNLVQNAQITPVYNIPTNIQPAVLQNGNIMGPPTTIPKRTFDIQPVTNSAVPSVVVGQQPPQQIGQAIGQTVGPQFSRNPVQNQQQQQPPPQRIIPTQQQVMNNTNFGMETISETTNIMNGKVNTLPPASPNAIMVNQPQFEQLNSQIPRSNNTENMSKKEQQQASSNSNAKVQNNNNILQTPQKQQQPVQNPPPKTVNNSNNQKLPQQQQQQIPPKTTVPPVQQQQQQQAPKITNQTQNTSSKNPPPQKAPAQKQEFQQQQSSQNQQHSIPKTAQNIQKPPNLQNLPQNSQNTQNTLNQQPPLPAPSTNQTNNNPAPPPPSNTNSSTPLDPRDVILKLVDDNNSNFRAKLLVLMDSLSMNGDNLHLEEKNRLKKEKAELESKNKKQSTRIKRLEFENQQLAGKVAFLEQQLNMLDEPGGGCGGKSGNEDTDQDEQN